MMFKESLTRILLATLTLGMSPTLAKAEDVFAKLDESLKPCVSTTTYCVYIPVRPVFDLDKRRIGIKVSHAALGGMVAGMEKYLKRTDFNENLVHNFSYTPLENGMRIDFSYQEKTFSKAVGGGVFKTGESNLDMFATLSDFSFDGQGNVNYRPQFIVKDANSSGVNIATRELVIGEVMGFLSERFGTRMTLSQTLLNFGALLFNFNSVFNSSKLDVTPLTRQLKENNITLNHVMFDQYGLTLAGTFSDQLIDKELDAMTEMLVDIIVNSMNDNNLPVRKQLVDDLRKYIRESLAKQIPGYAVPSAELDQSINLIASGKSSYASELARLKKLPLRALPLAISVRMKGKTSAAINETVANKILGGKAPYRYELIQGPSTYNYFSFDAATGIFLFQPNDLFTTQTISYKVIDSLNQQANGVVSVSFDYSDITPGHPPVEQPPQPNLPVAINAIFTVSAEQPSDARRLDGSNGEKADLLKATGGSLTLEAEAFLENVEDGYTGALNCKVDWKGVNDKANSLQDNDTSDRNFFVQKTIPAATLQANQISVFALNCSAPNAPSITREIPVSYLASAFMCQYKHKKDSSGGKAGQITTLDATGKTRSCDKNGDWKTSCKDGNGDTEEVACDDKRDAPSPDSNVMCQYKHKKDTAGGKSGQVTSLDASGKAKSCDKNGDWKTSCKDGNGDTDEVGCNSGMESPAPISNPSMCQYKHKKDTSGGKSGQVTGLDASGKTKSCDKNGDWKTSCKDGNGDTDEVACQ